MTQNKKLSPQKKGKDKFELTQKNSMGSWPLDLLHDVTPEVWTSATRTNKEGLDFLLKAKTVRLDQGVQHESIYPWEGV